MIFKIPNSCLEAKFIQHKNKNWKLIMINPMEQKEMEVERSMSPETTTRIIREMIINPMKFKKEIKENRNILKAKIKKCLKKSRPKKSNKLTKLPCEHLKST